MRRQFLLFILPLIFKSILILITGTCRVRWHNKELFDQLHKSKQGWILSIWHENVLILPWLLSNSGIATMVSDSRDGEYIARCVQTFGNPVIRGSSSKGSAKATRSALRLLKNNSPIAITPDGPRGPAHKLQAGVLWLSALGKVPIIPLHIEVDHHWRFKSWDGQKLPRPFSTIHISVGSAYQVSGKLLKNELNQVVDEFETAMMDNTNRARELAGYSLITK